MENSSSIFLDGSQFKFTAAMRRPQLSNNSTDLFFGYLLLEHASVNKDLMFWSIRISCNQAMVAFISLLFLECRECRLALLSLVFMAPTCHHNNLGFV